MDEDMSLGLKICGLYWIDTEENPKVGHPAMLCLAGDDGSIYIYQTFTLVEIFCLFGGRD